MIWPVIFVVVGLVLTLIGMVITFRADPPHPEPPSIEEHAKWQMKFLLALNRGKILRPFLAKSEWSRAGIYLLWSGTSLQLIGAVWQMVRMACRG